MGSDDLFEHAIDRAQKAVEGERRAQEDRMYQQGALAARRQGQMNRMRAILHKYAERLQVAQQPMVTFHSTHASYGKRGHQVEIDKVAQHGFVVGFYSSSSSDYARHQLQMDRKILDIKGRLWGWVNGPVERPSGFRRKRDVYTAQPVSDEYFTGYEVDLAKFAELLALDFARRTTDERYAEALSRDFLGGEIEWVWSRDPTFHIYPGGGC
ncbi:hypothetical protein [Micromonospora wenchangensis]|uniref:hypothetical protein n=1 Tax=Micromonospora wenchangensis TaxID=1185415 RepID=UPI00380B2935